MTDPLAIALLDVLGRDPDALEQLRAKLGEASGMLEPWVGVHEAATHLNCRPHRVYDLVSNRVIRTVRMAPASCSDCPNSTSGSQAWLNHPPVKRTSAAPPPRRPSAEGDLPPNDVQPFGRVWRSRHG